MFNLFRRASYVPLKGLEIQAIKASLIFSSVNPSVWSVDETTFLVDSGPVNSVCDHCYRFLVFHFHQRFWSSVEVAFLWFTFIKQFSLDLSFVRPLFRAFHYNKGLRRWRIVSQKASKPALLRETIESFPHHKSCCDATFQYDQAFIQKEGHQEFTVTATLLPHS